MRQRYDGQLPQPVEAIMAVRLSDGSITCFQGPVDNSEFRQGLGFSDPLGPHSVTSERSFSSINWLPGVRLTRIPGVEDWGWRQPTDQQLREDFGEIEAEQTKTIEPYDEDERCEVCNQTRREHPKVWTRGSLTRYSFVPPEKDLEP